MNSHLLKISFLLVVFLFIQSSSYGDPTEDMQEYIQNLHIHDKNETFLTIREDFRVHLKADSKGLLINEILADKKLRGMLFANFDAAPDQFIDIILAEYLMDDSNWDSAGGLFRSPSGGIASVIVERLIPKGTESGIPSDSFPYVLEDRKSRIQIANTLRNLYSKIDLPYEDITKRRSAAWKEIAQLVNSSFERLLEKDNQQREIFSRMDQHDKLSGTSPNDTPHIRPAAGDAQRPNKRPMPFGPEEQSESAWRLWLWIGGIGVALASLLMWFRYSKWRHK